MISTRRFCDTCGVIVTRYAVDEFSRKAWGRVPGKCFQCSDCMAREWRNEQKRKLDEMRKRLLH